jgi:hypothetical protein
MAAKEPSKGSLQPCGVAMKPSTAAMQACREAMQPCTFAMQSCIAAMLHSLAAATQEKWSELVGLLPGQVAANVARMIAAAKVRMGLVAREVHAGLWPLCTPLASSSLPWLDSEIFGGQIPMALP